MISNGASSFLMRKMKMSSEEIVKRLLDIHNSMLEDSKARRELSDLIDEIEGVNL